MGPVSNLGVAVKYLSLFWRPKNYITKRSVSMSNIIYEFATHYKFCRRVDINVFKSIYLAAKFSVSQKDKYERLGRQFFTVAAEYRHRKKGE